MPPSFHTALILTFLLDLLLKEFRYEWPLRSWHESSISLNRSMTTDKHSVGASLIRWAALITKLTNKISLQKEVVFFQREKCLQNGGEWRLILLVLPSLCSSGLKVKRTLAVTVPIWSQFPGTSRQECCCLSTINNNTAKIEGIQMDVTLALRLSASLWA